MKFHTIESPSYTLVEFELDGPISPEILQNLNPPHVNFKKGVILSGRGPVWLYSYLTHHYHPAAWVATNDPRLGAVVVASHTPEVKPGMVIDI